MLERWSGCLGEWSLSIFDTNHKNPGSKIQSTTKKKEAKRQIWGKEKLKLLWASCSLSSSFTLAITDLQHVKAAEDRERNSVSAGLSVSCAASACLCPSRWRSMSNRRALLCVFFRWLWQGHPRGRTHEESKKMLTAWALLLFLAMWVRSTTGGPLSFRIGTF